MTNYDILKEYEAHKTPVPSYEELQELQKNLKSITDSYKVVAGRCTQLEKFIEEFNALDVAKENQKLKSLLKEWMHFYPIILYEHEDTLKTRDIVELYEKTREVLKCKK